MEEILEYLTRHGAPSLWLMRNGEWACTLDVYVTPAGTSFKIKFLTGKTPLAALIGCKKNLDDALDAITRGLNTTKPTLKG